MNQLPADGPWRAAFEEAWASWCAGNFGIGAALVNPDTTEIVSRGRNRIVERPTEPRRLAGNFMAHAEMNAFAALSRMNASELHLYTTLEPCLMCAATTLMMQVEHVHYAAPDEFMASVNDLWRHDPFTADRRPDRSGPLDGPVGALARVLPLTFVHLYMADTVVATNAAETTPDLWAAAGRALEDSELAAVKHDSGDVTDALAVVADLL